MKPKSTNIFYYLGLLPLTVLDFALGMWLARAHLWLVIVLGVLCVLVVGAVIRKFRCLPHTVESYGKLIPSTLTLPGRTDIALFESEEMARYDFMVRVAEFLSPMHFNDEKPKLIINPKMRKEYGDTFMQIAGMREVRRYETHGALRLLLRLVIPVEAMITVALCVFAFQVDLSQYFSNFFLNFILPFLLVVLLVGDLYLWNRSISAQDARLDSFLTSCFSVQDIENYILTIEALEGGNEKENSKKFNAHYAQERIKRLHAIQK